MGRRGIRIAAVLCCALILCLQPAAHAAQARIPLSAGEIGIREFEVSSSVNCETVFTLEGWEWLKSYLADGYRRPEGLDLVQLLGTSKTAAGMLGKLYYEGLSRSARLFVQKEEKAVYAPLSADPFGTGLSLVAAGVVFRRNGNTDGWYVSSVSAAYDGDAVRGIIARYLPDIDMKLQCYSLFTYADSVMYVSHYPAVGGYREAWAVDAKGTHYKSVPSYSPYKWYCEERKAFLENNSLLLLPQDLAVDRLP